VVTTPGTTRPDKARSLAWPSSSRCEKTWARTRVVHIVTCGVRVASWCACTQRVQCGMWLVGCYLFKACVMRHAVLCRSTRCVVNRQSSRPVCRESCFDFRLRTSAVRAGVCGPRAAHGDGRCSMEPRAGKMLTARVRRRASRKASGPRGATGDGGLDAATACDGLSDSPTASQWGARRRSRTRHVASRRRPAAVGFLINSVSRAGVPPVRGPTYSHGHARRVLAPVIMDHGLAFARFAVVPRCRA
jgi:hypothetical protein